MKVLVTLTMQIGDADGPRYVTQAEAPVCGTCARIGWPWEPLFCCNTFKDFPDQVTGK